MNQFNAEHFPGSKEELNEDARTGIYHLIREFINRDRVKDWTTAYECQCYTARIDTEFDEFNSAETLFRKNIVIIKWERVLLFLERMYERHLNFPSDKQLKKEGIDYYSGRDLEKEFEFDLNRIFEEDQAPFVMEKGEIRRIGSQALSRALNKSTSILGDPKLKQVKKHYQNALRFFQSASEPDYPNSIKESVQALEVGANILLTATKDLQISEVIKKYRNGEESLIHPVILNIISNVYAYRGDAAEVAHGKITSMQAPSKAEADLVLCLVADLITYMYYLSDATVEKEPF